jgi:hypothetical protein
LRDDDGIVAAEDVGMVLLDPGKFRKCLLLDKAVAIWMPQGCAGAADESVLALSGVCTQGLSGPSCSTVVPAKAGPAVIVRHNDKTTPALMCLAWSDWGAT